MVKTNKKKYVLSLAIILGLLIVIAMPVLLQNTPTSFPLQPNTLANTQTLNQVTSKANPQPVNLWWNYSWNYRIEVNLTEQGYTDRMNAPVIVNLTFPSGHCWNNSIRVLYHSGTSWVEVPSQVATIPPPSYSGQYILSCQLIFLCNVTKSGTSTYYVYYNDTYNISPPNYTTPLNIYIKPGGTSYFTFDTGVISGNYTIRYSNTTDPATGKYFDDDACFRIFKVMGFNIIPTRGLHSGIDRIDADDLQRFVPYDSPYVPPYNTLNWTATLDEFGPLRAIVRISKLSTDRFTNTSGVGGGSYGPMNKTYTFYAYQGFINVNVNCTTDNVPIYDFAVINVTTNPSWRLYIDNYDLGVASSYLWTDTLTSPQPYYYAALVRSDNIGFGVIGSPRWPHDLFSENRTSVEYGQGGVDSGVSSFIFRNDGRPTHGYEYRTHIPFNYTLLGITQGFNEVINAWYHLNQPVNSTKSDETPVFYPLEVNVTDNFYNAIPEANVTVYNSPGPTGYNTSGITNSQGLYTFLINKNYTTDQYWIQAYVNTNYRNYTSEAVKWNPLMNVTWPPPQSSTLNIRMNITTVYVEVWDNNSHRVQNANVTLNYTDASLTDISQNVDLYYANCSFYAWANVNLTIEIWINTTKESGITVYKNGTTEVVSQPINITESKAFRVELNRDILKVSTILTYLGGIITIFWSDNVSFYVWFNVTGGSSIDDADWVNYTIFDSNNIPVYNGSMTNVSGNPLGNYYANFNTSLVGLSGGSGYTITVTAKSNDTNHLYPTPVSVFLDLENLPVVPTYPEYVEQEWSSFIVLPVLVNLYDTHNNQPVTGATVNYTITGTSYVNQNMPPFVEAGYYYIPLSVFNSLGSGQYRIFIVAFKGNYSIPSFNPVTLNITTVRTALNVGPPSPIRGSWNQNITIYANFTRVSTGLPVTDANVSWHIKDTDITGTMYFDGTGYVGQIPNNTLSSGVYTLTVVAGKGNYTTLFETVSLEILGASTMIGSIIWIPQLFGGSSDYLFMGPLVQVENSWTLVPVIFTYLDSNGNPVPNATITVMGGLPVFDIGSGTITSVSESQVNALQVGAGVYLVLVPISGFPPSTLPLSIVAQATNYQTQQTPIILSIKERTIALAPGVRVPVSVFLITVTAVAIPTGLFLTYTIVKRARIPAIIKRIDELIRAISRGEKVTVKLIPREKVIADILREELAIVGVEPRVEKYIPVELADLIVPLLVESGMKQKEAYAMALELKTAAPAQREKLLESVGIPGESSARIIQTIEEYEEKQAQVPIRKPRGREPIEEAAMEEAEEEPEEIEVELESALPKLDVDTVEGVGDKTASKFRTADINTVEDLANCDPQGVSETTEIPVHKVQEYKNKALSLLKLKLDDEVIDTLAKQGYSIQKAIEEAPSVLEKITGYGKERIRKFLEDFSKLSMLVAADTSRKKLISLLRRPKIKIKKAKPTKEEPEEGED
nr:hypothetical protein [Candidatus Freyarchaeota archaeon]